MEIEISDLEWAESLIFRIIDLIHKHGGKEMADKIAADLEADIAEMDKEDGIQAH